MSPGGTSPRRLRSCTSDFSGYCLRSHPHRPLAMAEWATATVCWALGKGGRAHVAFRFTATMPCFT